MDTGYPAPPAQTRTCSFPASGSSVALASAQLVAVSDHALFAIPRSEVGLRSSDPTMSGASFLCGLRAPVESFPMWWAFPTSEYYA